MTDVSEFLRVNGAHECDESLRNLGCDAEKLYRINSLLEKFAWSIKIILIGMHHS